MSDPQNVHGTPGPNENADTASGGSPDDTDEVLDEETTDDQGRPHDNPSGG